MIDSDLVENMVSKMGRFAQHNKFSSHWSNCSIIMVFPPNKWDDPSTMLSTLRGVTKWKEERWRNKKISRQGNSIFSLCFHFYTHTNRTYTDALINGEMSERMVCHLDRLAWAVSGLVPCSRAPLQCPRGELATLQPPVHTLCWMVCAGLEPARTPVPKLSPHRLSYWCPK